MWPFKSKQRTYSADEVDAIIETLRRELLLAAQRSLQDSIALDVAKEELAKQAEELKLKFEADNQAKTQDLRGAYDALVRKFEEINIDGVTESLRARMDRIAVHVDNSLQSIKAISPKKRTMKSIPKKRKK